jgi:hypothetical protein
LDSFEPKSGTKETSATHRHPRLSILSPIKRNLLSSQNQRTLW